MKTTQQESLLMGDMAGFPNLKRIKNHYPIIGGRTQANLS